MSRIMVPEAPVLPSPPIVPEAPTSAPAPEAAKSKKYPKLKGEALLGYYNVAAAAAPNMTMKAFTESIGAQENYLKARLFDAYQDLGTDIIRFQPEVTVTPVSRRQAAKNSDVIELWMFKGGKCKTPFITSKAVPRHLLKELGATENDTLKASIENGRIVLDLVKAAPAAPVVPAA